VILRICTWLGATPWSVALRESLWVYPLIETVHVLALCLFLGFALLLDLRLLGLALRPAAVTELMRRVMPWTWAGFVLMVSSGVLLFYSDPVKFSANPYFRLKLVTLLAAGLNGWIFHVTVYRSVSTWDRAPLTPRRARAAGILSLLLWSAVVILGRLIAYESL
jgi:hypothetical protein